MSEKFKTAATGAVSGMFYVALLGAFILGPRFASNSTDTSADQSALAPAGDSAAPIQDKPAGDGYIAESSPDNYSPTGSSVTSKSSTSSATTNSPVAAVGESVKSATAGSCDPNYFGACVSIASDVDCGGGSGNGPAYLYGTATVIGVDIYDLDRDHDGLACE